jgi:hypothetical protein
MSIMTFYSKEAGTRILVYIRAVGYLPSLSNSDDNTFLSLQLLRARLI